MWLIELINTNAGSMVAGALISAGSAFLITKQSNRETKRITKERNRMSALEVMREAILVLEEEATTRLKADPIFNNFKYIEDVNDEEAFEISLVGVDPKLRMPNEYFKDDFFTHLFVLQKNSFYLKENEDIISKIKSNCYLVKLWNINDDGPMIFYNSLDKLISDLHQLKNQIQKDLRDYFKVN